MGRLLRAMAAVRAWGWVLVVGGLGCGPAPAAAPSSAAATVAPVVAPVAAPASSVAPSASPPASSVAEVQAQPSASREPPPPAPEPEPCGPAPTAPGFSDCEAVEVTGEPPCEAICRRPRRLPAPNRCCEHPVEVAVLAGGRVVLRVAACDFVPPDCADVHGHGNMDSTLRVLEGPPPEVVVVEGGCEMRAMAHGYVPPGVAAWSGCRHQRYGWDGKNLVAR